MIQFVEMHGFFYVLTLSYFLPPVLKGIEAAICFCGGHCFTWFLGTVIREVLDHPFLHTLKHNVSHLLLFFFLSETVYLTVLPLLSLKACDNFALSSF